MMAVPYYPQTLQFSCVSACVRMILEFYGIVADESEVVEQIQRFRQGAYIGDLERLTDWRTDLTVEIAFPGDETSLHAHLDAGEPVLVYVYTRYLS